ncbi:MAG: YafY family transcriptional regulator [Sneathiellales bacterium]|nr:YafY family transcriptional regulator [Sneathiellales bacterium]
MMRIQRLFSILDHLRLARRPVSAESLAEKFEVSLRTIYRDMGMLQSMGAPVRGEGGIGYQIESGYFLPPLHFDDDEMDALILGMRLVSVRGDAITAQAAAKVLSKINAGLGKDRKDEVFNAPLKAYSQNDLPLLYFSPLRRAIRKRRYTEIDYLDLKGSRSARTIRPLGISAFDDVWLLTAWCELRKDFRNFRIDRLDRLEITDQSFPREKGKELDDYLCTL